MASKITVNLDTSKENYLLEKCKQNDDLTLEAFIFENGAKKSLANTAITINVLKPDGTFVAGSVNVGTQVTDNKITYPIDRQATVVPGKAKIDITIVENTNKNNSTFEFDLIIKPLVTANAIASTNTVPIIQELQDKINEGGAIRDEIVQQIQAGGVQQWTQSEAAPVNTNGNQGDWHINSKDGTIYQKTGAAAWTSKANLATDEDIRKIQNYTGYPQGTKPPKTGSFKNSYKIVKREADRVDGTKTINVLTVVQPTNEGCIKYTFERNNGASGPGDYGTYHQLLRIVKAEWLIDAYVYYDIETIASGAWDPTTPQSAAGKANSSEQLLFDTTTATIKYNSAKTLSSKTNGGGFAVHKLAANNGTVTFNLPMTMKNKANLLFLASAASSNNVEISVNNVPIKTFNPRAFIDSANGNSMGLIEFEIPMKKRESPEKNLQVKITNKATTGFFFPCCLNFFRLKDYNGEPVNQFKYFGSDRGSWIDSAGASEYAFHDNTSNKWYGSYHGGEVLESDQILWGNNVYERESNDNARIAFSTIPTDQWRVQQNLVIYQHTKLAGTNLTSEAQAKQTAQAEVSSWFSFNTDGTLDMDLSYYNGKVTVNTFYTALTCTEKNFQYVFYPKNINLGAIPLNTTPTTYTQLPLSTGYVSQVNGSAALQLDIRFTKFNDSSDTRGPVIANSYAYRKLYYGPVYGATRLIENITFSKSLDFIVR